MKMRNVHDQLYRTKVALVAVSLTVIGLGLVLGAAWLAQQRGWSWINHWHVTDIGLAIFTTGLVAVAFTYIDGKDKEVRDAERLGHAVESRAPAIVQAVLDGLTASSANMELLAPAQQDQLIRNGLAARLGDVDFATEVYNDIRDQAVRAAERWHDAKVSIRLSPLPMGSQGTFGALASSAREPLYVVTVRSEYRVIPKHQVRHFACVSDKTEYRELIQDSNSTSAWYLRPTAGVDAGTREAFELVQFSVDGENRTIRRTSRKGGQSYTVDIGSDAVASDKAVTVAYTYRTLTARNGHLLYFDIEQPTKSVSVEFDYGDVDISSVSVVDSIASSRQARIIRSPKSVPGRLITVEFDGWVFPRSSVAFVWHSGPAAPESIEQP